MKKITLLFLGLVMFLGCSDSDPADAAIEYGDALGSYGDKADSTSSAATELESSASALLSNPAEIMALSQEDFKVFVNQYLSEWRVVQDNIEMVNTELEVVNQKAIALFEARKQRTQEMTNEALRQGQEAIIKVQEDRYQEFYQDSKVEIESARAQITLSKDYIIIMENAQAFREISGMIPQLTVIASKLSGHGQKIKDLVAIGQGVADYQG